MKIKPKLRVKYLAILTGSSQHKVGCKVGGIGLLHSQLIF